MTLYRILREDSGNEHSPDWRDDGILFEAESPSGAIDKANKAGVFGYDFIADPVPIEAKPAKKKYRCNVETHIDVEADSKDEADEKARTAMLERVYEDEDLFMIIEQSEWAGT